MPSVKEQRSAQAEAAAARFEERADKRRANIELIETPGGLARADSEERVRKRLARLRRYYAGETLP